MRNQVAAAVRMGVRAATINSDNRNDWTKVEAGIANGETDILLISPERLANEHFRTDVLASIAAHISMLVIDEAHCISDWGHDFHPHYRLLERIVKTLPPNLRLLATTATANDRVMEDLAAVLGPRLDISRGDLNRSSLSLQTIRLPSQAQRLAWLAEQLDTLQGHGIIYALTVRDANQIAQWLQSRGFNVEAYTGETGERRELLEQALLDNQVKALVATTAPGMGYDKPDLAFVIHYQMPGSVVACYQRNFLLDGRLVLVSPYDPSVGCKICRAGSIRRAWRLCLARSAGYRGTGGGFRAGCVWLASSGTSAKRPARARTCSGTFRSRSASRTIAGRYAVFRGT